jgi:chemotaxis protein MotB
MKNSFRLLAFGTIILGLTLSSCGPGKKLTASMYQVETLQTDSINTHLQLNECNAKLIDYNSEVNDLESQKTSLQNENTIAQKDLNQLSNDLNQLSSESNMTIAEQREQLRNFQNLIQSQRDAMSKLKNSISAALMNYKTDELYVYIKDGNVYVSMEENLLFKSGSDVVDPKGKEALKSLAVVLNKTKDITVMIEGHTDNVPIKTVQFEDNWDLSTARATSIVRILTKDNGLDPNRITASGKSEFHPIKTNETEAGRAGNRRTEVILSPDMKGIYNLLD